MIELMTWLITRGAQIAICFALTLILVGVVRSIVRDGL